MAGWKGVQEKLYKKISQTTRHVHLKPKFIINLKDIPCLSLSRGLSQSQLQLKLTETDDKDQWKDTLMIIKWDIFPSNTERGNNLTGKLCSKETARGCSLIMSYKPVTENKRKYVPWVFFHFWSQGLSFIKSNKLVVK